MFLKREKIPYVDEPFVTKRNLEENIIESIRTLVAPFTEIPSVTGLHNRIFYHRSTEEVGQASRLVDLVLSIFWPCLPWCCLQPQVGCCSDSRCHSSSRQGPKGVEQQLPIRNGKTFPRCSSVFFFSSFTGQS